MVIAANEAEQDRRRKIPFPTAEIADNSEYEDMAMGPERSRTSLHNFSSLPCFNVKWGRVQHLRCIKHSRGDGSADQKHRSHLERRRSPAGDGGGGGFDERRSGDDDDVGGIEAVREKLMLDLRTEVHQMKEKLIFSNNADKTADTAARPWNLRTRRAACKEPSGSGSGGADRKPSCSPARGVEVKTSARRVAGDDVYAGDKGPRAKFSVSLSKQEIEEDFLSILGTRPARRPKKRPKLVQRQMDVLFPGFWLSEVTADMYKVDENPEATKK